MKYLCKYCCIIHCISRAPYGARGLKYLLAEFTSHLARRRAPYGARGLKYPPPSCLSMSVAVAPRMGRVD